MCNLLLAFYFFLFFAVKLYISSAAIDSISHTSSLTGNQTLISKEGKFELGFFRPSKSSNNYYIGVWYKNLPKQTVIWIANRVEPVTDPNSSQLKLSNDGNLILLNSSKHQIWSTRATSKATHATLLDTSNFVLTDESGLNVWQSFDHNTDTVMPGGRIGFNKITREYNSMTCWESPDNPAPGPYMLTVDHDGSNQYASMWNGSEVYWTSGLWTGQYYTAGSVGPSDYMNLTFTDTPDQKTFTFIVTNSSIITRTIVSSDGLLQIIWWYNDTQEWQPIMARPYTQCDVYSYCGSCGICDLTRTNICSCISGFEPMSTKEWESNHFNKGCVRKTKLECGGRNNTRKDGFVKMGDVRLPLNPVNLSVTSQKECETTCVNNCSCVAYSYNNICLIWINEIKNLQQFYGSSNIYTGDLYIHLSTLDLPNSGKSHNVIIEVSIGIPIGVIIVFFSIFSMILVRRKWRRTKIEKKVINNPLIMFSYKDLLCVTQNFSDLLGTGGFGSVFRGSLPDLTKVAVKKLEGSNQGEKQFRAEISTLSAIQHVNLVKLRGFCSETNRRLIVYEYMMGGSLDFLLFKKNKTNLTWKIRYQIILGIARGIAYLHEECIERIIHCDIKPDNILLDSNYYAKVADFGMAKLVGRDFSRILTTMRGTIGYLAPEWLSGQPITTKVDVYSFGMMLFEIISGKRNFRDFEEEKETTMGYFPFWAAKKVIDDDIVCLLDERLQSLEYDMHELKRACRIACWCIQDSEFHRPTMSQVVRVLEGLLEVNVPPMPRALEHLMGEKLLSKCRP